MKIMCLFLFLGMGFAFASSSYSQSTNFSISANNKTVKEVFDEIEKNSEFIFFYYDNVLDLNRKVSVQVKDQTVDRVLDQLFTSTKNSYKIVDRQIFITAKETKEQQQNALTVNGVIVDSKTGETLPGVSVKVKDNPAIGTSTDENGTYSLRVPNPDRDVLVFTYVGYEPAEKPVKKLKVINVSLEQSSELLEEVVVMGYGTQKKGSVIGSVERLDAKQLKMPSRTLSTSLAGNLAGVVSMQASGEPGFDSANFWIRGINTFAGGSTPLVLVDGIERSLDDVEPEDIADFTVLKDATATAVYGVRGANGVILVTTKKGAVTHPLINVKIENAFSDPIYLPNFLGGVDYMTMHNEALVNQGLQPIYSLSQIENTRNRTDPYYYPDTDWMGEMMKDYNLYQKVTLNISGGSDFIRYYVSGAFLNQDGMYKKFGGVSYNNNINYKRYNFRTNVDVNATKTTLLNVQVAALQENRTAPAFDSGDIFGWMMDTSPIQYPLNYQDDTKVPGISYSQGRNPYQLLARSGYSEMNMSKAQSSFTVTQDLNFITQGLSAKGLFSFDNERQVLGVNSMTPRPYLVKPYGFDPETGEPILIEDGKYNYVDQDPSSTQYHDYLTKTISSNWSRQVIYLEASLNYGRAFGKHVVGGLFLYNQSEESFPERYDVYNSVSHRRQGATGRATYAYADKYFAEFNFGYTGSENFAKGHRYGFFPSYAVGWVPTEESFMDWMKPAISYMKMRVSFGQVGNDALGEINSNAGRINRFVYLSRVSRTSSNVGFGVNNGYGYGAGSGMDITYYGNPDATWETANKLDMGIEVNFLNGFRLQTDFFYESRKDIWTQLTKIPDIYGYGNAQPGGNVGEMENRGFDGTLEYSRAIKKDWQISFKGTYTFAKNKVLANGSEVPKYDYQDYIGQSKGRTLGYVAEGFFVDQAEIDNSPAQTAIGGTPKPGDIKYKDVNGDGAVDSFDQIFLGYPDIPQFVYGLGASTKYKDLDFSFLFQGSSQVSFYAKPRIFSQQGRGNVYSFYKDNYWSEVDQNLDAKFPRLATGAQAANYVNSTWWLEDASYLRLRSIELGYSLPDMWVKKLNMRNVRVYVNGVNLLTFSPFKWWDPESRNQTGMYYPIQKTVNFGLEVKF